MRATLQVYAGGIKHKFFSELSLCLCLKNQMLILSCQNHYTARVSDIQQELFMQYPVGVSPQFISKGEKGHVWDIDGNEYVDFVSGLLAVSLGYKFAPVDKAVINQMQLGVSFSLPTEIEYEVAKLLVEIIPSAEMVRFTKTGSDATSAAVRLARAYTKKDLIAVCGYHGWHDWYIGATTRNSGIPSSVQDCTVAFEYNSISSLEKKVVAENKGKLAAVIMEPMNAIFPNPGYLEDVRQLTSEKGIILIFDEIVLSLRLAPGVLRIFWCYSGFVCLWKGNWKWVPNRRCSGFQRIMCLSTEIFFFWYFGGEALSLVACKSVLEFVQKNSVVDDFSKKRDKNNRWRNVNP